jgi:predicted RND superfamily exporter protein
VDLKFFEKNFKGVMPLEIIVDTKTKRGVVSNLTVIRKMDELSTLLQSYPEVGHPLSITNGIKFASQAYFGGDSSYYEVPSDFGAAFLQPYLLAKSNDKNSMSNRLLNSFIDSNKQKARISVSMADIGTRKLPALLNKIRPEVYKIFDSSKYKVTFTGTSVTFLEGSKFIVHSLRDSLILAFLIIFGCMVALFRSWRILLISIVVNIVPLLITAGLMGWLGIRIKPSTVLVFSVALGITIDVTIRFLVNFKQELAMHDDSIANTVHRTIHDTGLSIIYTSLILIAGFGVFMLSQFDGTKSLGYLTSMTLLLAMVTNLTLLPALLLWMDSVIEKRNKAASFLMGEDDTDVIKLND